MLSALTTYIFAAQINAFCGSVSDNFKVYNVNIREEEMILMPYCLGSHWFIVQLDLVESIFTHWDPFEQTKT